VVLKAFKPTSPKYPKNLRTFGDHIRQKRLDLGLYQRDVATQIGVSEATIYNWERNATTPQVHQLPKIILFLGYDPWPLSGSFAERLLSSRKKLGLNQKAMAAELGMDPTTLGRLENGKVPSRSSKLYRTVCKRLGSLS
jgi:transcriptional regulator with XRE-family HTH domain